MNKNYATLVGYHGRKNFGDDIFLQVSSDWVNKKFKINNIYVAGKKEGVPSEIKGVKIFPFEKSKYLITRFLWVDIFIHALKSRYILFSAGSIFTIQPFFLAWILLSLVKKIKGHNFGVGAMGVSIGPFRDKISLKYGPKLIKLMDFCILRDRASFDLIEQLSDKKNYSLSYDLALQWGPAWSYKKRHNGELKVIGVCFHPGAWGGVKNMGYESNLAIYIEALRHFCLKNKNTHVKVFAACSDDLDGETEFVNFIYEELGKSNISAEEIIYNGSGTEEFANNIQQCDAVITSRMHVGIIGMMGAVPVFQLDYARKVGDFYGHTGLSSDFLYSATDVTSADIRRFLEESVTGSLLRLAEDRMNKLKNLSTHVLKSMDFLAEKMSKVDN